ncbi:MAG TPA: flagellar basal-body rod protein FlgB [Devosia sp.]|nr:flagellar basal-body rod protein FlgB [Devosia sp.]
MAIGGIPIFQALADKMRWHQARQTLLSENVANADTPDYKGRDLKPFSLDSFGKPLSMATVTTSTISPHHIAISSFVSGGGFGADDAPGYETTPEGTRVSLEDEMMKVTSNELDYQTATTLYTRSLRLIRTALGKSA